MPSKSIKKSKKSSTTRKSTKSQKKAVASSKRKVARRKPVTQPIEVEASPSFWESYAEHKERIHSLVYLFGIFVCIYIGLSMLSYDPTIVEGHNVGGVLGNHMAQLLFHFFGYGAWSILFLGGTCAWKLAKRSIGGVARIVGFWGLLWAFNCSLSLVFPAALEQGYFAGGVLGHSTANFLTWIIGPAGAWLTITAWTIGLSLLIVGMDIGGFTNRWIESIESKWPSVGQRSLSFFREVIYWIKDIVVSFKDGLFSRESEEDTQWEEEDSMWYLTDHGTEVEESESIASSEVIEEVDSYHEGFPHSVSEEVELTKTRVKHSESQPSTRSEVSWESTAASQMGTLDNHESLINAKVYSIEESAVGLSRTKSQHAIIPPVEEDISIWYQNSDPSQIDEEDALNALLNEMEQHVSSSSPSSDFSMLSEPSMEAKEKVVQKKSVQVDSFSEPPPVESMSESEVSHHMIFEDEAPSLEVEPEIIPTKKRSTKKKSKIQSFSEPVVEEQIVEEKQNKVEISGPSINPGNLVSGGKKENIVIESDYSSFQLPSLSLLDEHEEEVAQFDEKELRRLSVLLEERLADFNVRGEVMAIRPGPVITTFEFKPARGIKVSKISGLSDDIAMALMAVRVRIVAPIPGRDVVGIEIPNKNRQIIWGLDMVGSDTFQKSDGTIPLVLGKSVEGLPVVCDLAKMPHLLVGGTTGSGKSVGINTMILSMLYKHSPDSLRLILIDPKMLEFEMYHDIPHLIHPVITDSNLATGILKWACDEMDTRYALMAKFKTRTIISFNKRLAKELKDWTPEKARKLAPIGWSGTGVPPKPKKMPYIVIVIDELADLMMVAGKDVESSIIRIAQKARACGIHLIVATQRPSVDVITGMIKANMPCRISFQVRQRTDSRTILDQNGGENLLGRGDMLFLPPGISSLLRCHGPFISDDEVRRVTDFLRGQAKPMYEAKVVEAPPQLEENANKDDLYDLTVEYIASMGKASTSMIQRKFRIGYNRAARLMDTMEEEGLIGPADGAKPRKVFAKPIV